MDAAQWKCQCLEPDTALATMLFRQIDIGRGVLNNAYTYGVSQDLGISSHSPDCADTPWHLGVGGDGWAVAVDPNDPKHALAMAGSFFSTVDGKSWQAGTGLSTTTQPVYFDPNGQIVYALVNSKLFRSTNNGAIFSLMKTFPTPLTAINMVKRDFKTIWLGGSDGTVWHTNDANNGIGATWIKTSVPGAPNNQGASGIAVDPSNTSKVVVIYTPGRAFSTTNNGATWTDITGKLRNLRVNSVVIDPNTSPHAVIVATSTGVMLTTNLGGHGTNLGKGLPNVLCKSLTIDSTAVPSLLRVGLTAGARLNYGTTAST